MWSPVHGSSLLEASQRTSGIPTERCDDPKPVIIAMACRIFSWIMDPKFVSKISQRNNLQLTGNSHLEINGLYVHDNPKLVLTELWLCPLETVSWQTLCPGLWPRDGSLENDL